MHFIQQMRQLGGQGNPLRKGSWVARFSATCGLTRGASQAQSPSFTPIHKAAQCSMSTVQRSSALTVGSHRSRVSARSWPCSTTTLCQHVGGTEKMGPCQGRGRFSAWMVLAGRSALEVTIKVQCCMRLAVSSNRKVVA